MLVNEKVAIEHGLKADEYKKICELLKRTPNLTELGIFSAMLPSETKRDRRRVDVLAEPLPEGP